MKPRNWLNTLPTKPLIGAHSGHKLFRRESEWNDALERSRFDWERDSEYSALKSFIPTGHVAFPRPYKEFFYSEEFINAVFSDPQFFIAWRKINDL